MLRQGDVLLVEIPDGDRPETDGPVGRDASGRLVLAWGEATGHAHVVADVTARLVADRVGRVLCVDGAGATLVHDEHAPVEVPPGWWRVVRQREWQGLGRYGWVLD
jgi:hypothetical protein